MKTKLFCLILIVSKSLWAQMLPSLDFAKTAQNLEPVDALIVSQLNRKHDLANRTKDALLSYPMIEYRTNLFVQKLQRITFGEYVETLGYVTPFITGEINARIYDFNLNIDFYQGFGRLNYSYKF